MDDLDNKYVEFLTDAEPYLHGDFLSDRTRSYGFITLTVAALVLGLDTGIIALVESTAAGFKFKIADLDNFRYFLVAANAYCLLVFLVEADSDWRRYRANTLPISQRAVLLQEELTDLVSKYIEADYEFAEDWYRESQEKRKEIDDERDLLVQEFMEGNRGPSTLRNREELREKLTEKLQKNSERSTDWWQTYVVSEQADEEHEKRNPYSQEYRKLESFHEALVSIIAPKKFGYWMRIFLLLGGPSLLSLSSLAIVLVSIVS